MKPDTYTQEHRSPQPRWYGWRLGLLGIFALAVILYFPALRGIAIWDDEQLLTKNVFWGTNDLLGAFTHPFGSYYRPLTSASFAIENGLVNGQPLLYHIDNLVLHAITSVLVACLAFRVTGRQTAGILAGLFFATQPIQVGAAAWIGGRTDALSGLFLTLYLLSIVKFHQTENRKWLYGAAVAFFLAALTKEQAVAMLLAVPLSVFVFGSKKWADAWKICIPFGVVLLVYAVMWKIGGPKPHAAPSDLSYTVMLAMRTAAHYGLAFVAPNEQSLVTFTLENYRSFVWIPVGGLFLIAIAYLLRHAWKTNREMFWLGMCALFVYIPISNCPTVPSLIVAPYRCAQAGIGVACLFGVGTAAAVANKRWILTALLASNFVAGTVVTWWGVHQWLAPMPFFEQVVKNDPHFMVGVEFYAHYLDDANRSAEAAQATGNCLTWLFDTENWAAVLDKEKLKAITAGVRRRLRANTGLLTYSTLGNFIATNAFSLARCNQYDQAAVVARDALIFSPKDSWVHLLYGRLVVRKDRQDAISHWETALKINPNYTECQVALAHQRIIDHRDREAAQLLESALKVQGNNGYAWLDLVDAKLALQDIIGAKAALLNAQKSKLLPKPEELERRVQAIGHAH